VKKVFLLISVVCIFVFANADKSYNGPTGIKVCNDNYKTYEELEKCMNSNEKKFKEFILSNNEEYYNQERSSSKTLMILIAIPVIIFLGIASIVAYKFVKHVNKEYDYWLLNYNNALLAILYTIGILIIVYLLVIYGFSGYMGLIIVLLFFIILGLIVYHFKIIASKTNNLVAIGIIGIYIIFIIGVLFMAAITDSKRKC